MKRLFLLLYCIFLPAAVFSVEKVLIYKISASAVSQSCTIAEGRCVVGSFYRPYVSAMDSADIVVNIEIDRKGKVVSAELDSTSVIAERKHTARWLAKAHIAAARKLIFNSSPSSEERQKGQVRYILHPKD